MRHAIYSHDFVPGEPVRLYAARGDVFPGEELAGDVIAETEAEGAEGGVVAEFDLEPADPPSAMTQVWVVSPSTVFATSVPGSYPLSIRKAA